jgi:hypothetical protein
MRMHILNDHSKSKASKNETKLGGSTSCAGYVLNGLRATTVNFKREDA